MKKIVILILLAISSLLSAQDLSDLSLQIKVMSQKYGIESLVLMPKSCPFKESSLFETSKLLSELVKSSQIQCQNKYQEIFLDLERKLDEMNGVLSLHEGQMYDKYDYEDYEAFEVQFEKLENQSFYLMQISKMMSTLSDLGANQKCGKALSVNNMLPLFSELLVNASSIGAAIPTATGLTMSYSAMSAGMLLNVLNTLLNSQVDWSNVENRQMFLKFNCSSYEIRRQLALQSSLKSYSSFSNQQLVSDLDEIQTLSEHVKQLHKELLNQRLDPEITNLYMLIKHIDSIDEKELFLSDEITAEMQIVTKIILDLSAFSFKENNLFIVRLKQDLADLIEQRPEVLGGADEWMSVVNSSEELHELFQQILKTFAWIRQDTIFKNSEVDQLNNQLINLDMFVKGQLRLKKHDEKLVNKTDGVNELYDVLQEYETLKNLIYGKDGKSFVRLLLSDAKHALKNFDRNYDRIVKSEYSSCGDYNIIENSWSLAYSAVMQAEAFIDLNGDLFQKVSSKNLAQKYLTNQMIDEDQKSDLSILKIKLQESRVKHLAVLQKITSKQCYM